LEIIENKVNPSLLECFTITTDMETAIMHKLQNIILEHTNTLLAVLDLSAELDW